MRKEKGLRAAIQKHSWLFLLVLMALSVLMYEAIPEAMAFTDRQQARQDFEDFMAGYSITSFEHMRKAYENFEGFIDGSKYNFSTTLTTFIEGVAMIMLVAYVGMALIKEAQKGEISMDYWTKIFVTSAVAIIALSAVPEIMQGLFGLGRLFIERAGQALEQGSYDVSVGTNQMADAISTIPSLRDFSDVMGTGENAVNDVNWYQLQMAGSAIKVLNYIVWFPMIICIFLMFSSLFEIRIRMIFAPIAVASIAHEGARGAGVRFLKKYLACYIKIAIYFAIAALGTMLTQYFFGRLDSELVGAKGIDINLILMLMANVVAGLAMMQSSGLGDEIVGA